MAANSNWRQTKHTIYDNCDLAYYLNQFQYSGEKISGCVLGTSIEQVDRPFIGVFTNNTQVPQVSGQGRLSAVNPLLVKEAHQLFLRAYLLLLDQMLNQRMTMRT